MKTRNRDSASNKRFIVCRFCCIQFFWGSFGSIKQSSIFFSFAWSHLFLRFSVGSAECPFVKNEELASSASDTIVCDIIAISSLESIGTLYNNF